MAASSPSGEVSAEPRASRPATVLVIDDEESVHRTVRQPLKGFRTISAYSGWQALRALEAHHIDVILLDLNLPDTTGFELLQQITTERNDVEVLVLTAHSEVATAVGAVKLGAFDYLVKSFETYQGLEQHIERALTHRRRKREHLESRSRDVWMSDAFALMDGTGSAKMREMVALTRRVADTHLSVLIEGETGAGKEVLARYIHARSERREAPFVSVNVASVPAPLLHSYLFGHIKGAFTGAESAQAGRFELASGGTLFLDEIGELSQEIQVQLLRAIQEREVERLGAAETTPVDVRVLAATHRNLANEVSAGAFREDLYYRLNVMRLVVPPLRERGEDMEDLARVLATKHSRIMRRAPLVFTQSALEILCAYDWPGNIRELENLVMRLCALYPGREIAADDVPPEFWLPTLNRRARDAAEAESIDDRLYHLACQQFQRYLVRLMIARAGGNKRAAARALGISYSTLKEKLREPTASD